MGLRDVIAKGIDSAYRALGDIPLDMTIRHYSGPKVRDMETGLYSSVFIDVNAQVIPLELTAEESTANNAQAVKKLMVKAVDVPTVSIGDVFISVEATYEALAESADPTVQIHEVFVRKSPQKVNLMVGTPLTEPRVFSGHGPPSGLIGAVAGDFYVDLDSGAFYEFS